MQNSDYEAFSMPKKVTSPYFHGDKQGIKIKYSIQRVFLSRVWF